MGQWARLTLWFDVSSSHCWYYSWRKLTSTGPRFQLQWCKEFKLCDDVWTRRPSQPVSKCEPELNFLPLLTGDLHPQRLHFNTFNLLFNALILQLKETLKFGVCVCVCVRDGYQHGLVSKGKRVSPCLGGFPFLSSLCGHTHRPGLNRRRRLFSSHRLLLSAARLAPVFFLCVCVCVRALYLFVWGHRAMPFLPQDAERFDGLSLLYW